MTLIDLLAAGLILPFVVNWLAFVVVAYVERQHPGSKTLTDRRWLSLGIAGASTALGVLAVSYFARITVDAPVFALLLTVPLYSLTAVNVVFLTLTARGKW